MGFSVGTSNCVSSQMLIIELEQVGGFPKAVGAPTIPIELHTWQQFTSLETVMFAQHLGRLDQQTLGLLTDKIVLRRVRFLAFWNKPQNVTDTPGLIPRPAPPP